MLLAVEFDSLRRPANAGNRYWNGSCHPRSLYSSTGGCGNRVCCDPEDDVRKALELMKEESVRRVLVVDAAGNL